MKPTRTTVIDPVPRVTVVPVGTNPWSGGRSDGIRVNLSGVTEIGPGITISIEPVGFAGEPSGSDPPGEAGNGFERNNGPGNVGLAASSTVTENHDTFGGGGSCENDSRSF